MNIFSTSREQRGITFIELIIVMSIMAMMATATLVVSRALISTAKDKQRNDDLSLISTQLGSYVVKERTSNPNAITVTPEDIDDLKAETLNRSLIRFRWDETFINPKGSINGLNSVSGGGQSGYVVPSQATQGTFDLLSTSNSRGKARLDFINSRVPFNINEEMLIIIAGAGCKSRSGDHDLVVDGGVHKGSKMAILYQFENDAHVGCREVSG